MLWIIAIQIMGPVQRRFRQGILILRGSGGVPSDEFLERYGQNLNDLMNG
jgi:hypothetical protein